MRDSGGQPMNQGPATGSLPPQVRGRHRSGRRDSSPAPSQPLGSAQVAGQGLQEEPPPGTREVPGPAMIPGQATQPRRQHPSLAAFPGLAGLAPERLRGQSDRIRAAMRGAIPLALAGLIANAANLGVTLVIARAMSTRSYGAVAQLFAIFFVVSMPGSALLVGVVRRITNWQHTGQADLIDEWIGRVRRAGVVLVLSVAVLAIIARGFVARELSLPGAGGVAEIIIAGAAWCLLCVDRGLMQCGRLYPSLATNLLVDAAVKSGSTIALVLAGLDEAGAAIAVLLGVLAALAHTRYSLRRHPSAIMQADPTRPQAQAPPAPAQLPAPTQLPAPPARQRRLTGGRLGSHPAAGRGDADTGATTLPLPVAGPAATAEPRRLAIEVGAALVTLAFLGVLQNIDVLLQGRLAPDESGSYAAVSVAAKVIVLAAIVLAGFLLPEAADRNHLGQHALHQLGATLAILAVPAVGLLTVAAIAPDTLLSLAFGPRFTSASGALLPLAGAMTCLGATVLFSHYLLALGKRAVLAVLAVATGTAVALMAWAQGSPVSTARANFGCQAVLAVVTGLMVLAAARRTARA
ncbi:conserved membrane hypothetical protein [Frankia sp. Hr75.2]|nr:conserved membrane hypothetical protein [Frankia sp. Hr75.2]